MDDFNFLIICVDEGKRETIATFRYETDCNYALDALQEAHPDCVFEMESFEI